MQTLTVLGIGNLLMRDDAIGVRLMEALRDSRPWGPDLLFVDGGAGGLNLLNVIEESPRLLVFDAADMRLAPGEFRVIAPDQVRSDSAGRLSLHDCPFIETWSLARQFLHAPETTLFAVQPALVERGVGLTAELSSVFDSLLAAATNLVDEILKKGRG